jgi:hypothetical protein
MEVDYVSFEILYELLNTCKTSFVVLGDLVVIVLAIETKVCVLKSYRVLWVSKGYKNL